MRLMYDSIRAASIPLSAGMVAGYCDTIHIPQWSDEEWARFTGIPSVRIAKKASTNDGHVLDVEVGDANPGEAPEWVLMRRAFGAIPTVYCNESTWPSVRDAFRSTGVAEPYYFIAKYDGVYGIPDTWLSLGVVAKQYRNTYAYDLSCVLDYWPGVDNAPFVTGKDDDMTTTGYASATTQMYPVRCSGARNLFILTGGTAKVTGHVYCIADTPPGTKDPKYTGDFPITIDADRPGPIPIPASTRGLTLWVTATGPFSAWCE